VDSNSNNQQAELAYLQWRDSVCTQLLKQRLGEYKEQILNEIKFKSVDAASPDNIIRYRAAQLKTVDDILDTINERGNIIRTESNSPRPTGRDVNRSRARGIGLR
jgi:hypothetical protein